MDEKAVQECWEGFMEEFCAKIFGHRVMEAKQTINGRLWGCCVSCAGGVVVTNKE